MLYKNRKMSQSEIDEIYEDFVIEIATKVAKQVKGKVYYGFATVEDMWYVIVKTRELGEKRFFLDTIDYDMLSGVSSKEIADNIVKFYHKNFYLSNFNHYVAIANVLFIQSTFTFIVPKFRTTSDIVFSLLEPKE